MRYENITILKDSGTGKRYYRGVKYPSIPYSDNDVYIITVFGDRLDVLAQEYYGNISDYWILQCANNLPGDSIFVAPNTQLRIPLNIISIKQSYNVLNKV